MFILTPFLSCRQLIDDAVGISSFQPCVMFCRRDKLLQRLVYKLIPGLLQSK